MLDGSIGLIGLLLAAASLIVGRLWFQDQPVTSKSADIGAMIFATLSTGLFAVGFGEMLKFVIQASGMWAWIDGGIATVGVVAIVAVSFYVANHMQPRQPMPTAGA